MRLFNPSKKSTSNDRVVYWERKIMRLCAVGIVTDGSLNNYEKSAIQEIIIRDWSSENKAGMFMEMDSIQKQVDVEKMERSMNNINDYIANLKKS